MAVDDGARRLFLCAEDNGTVEVIDLAAGRPLRSLSGFHEPKWAVYRPEQQRLYISQGNGTVAVLNSKTFASLTNYRFQEKANNLRFEPKTSELFVGVGKTFGAIAVIDTSKGKTKFAVPLANFPKQFEIDGDRLFVNVPAASHVAVIGLQTRKVLTTWSVGKSNENVPMGIDEARHRLFVGCETGRFFVFDTRSGRNVAALKIPAESDGVHYDAARRRIYVSCATGELEIIAQKDADHYGRSGSVKTAKGAGTSWYSPELDRLFVPIPAQRRRPAELRVYRPEPLK